MERNLTESRMIVPLSPLRLNLLVLHFTTDSLVYWLKCKTHMTTGVLSKHPILVLDAAVQTQHITNHLVKVPVTVQSSLLVFGFFHLFRQNGSQHWQKCLWKGMKAPSVSPAGSWQISMSTSWISPIGQPNYLSYFKLSSTYQHCSPHFWCDRNNCILQSAISKCCHIFSNGISHVAFKEISFWQRGPGFSVQNSCVMHVKKVVDGDGATCILWAHYQCLEIHQGYLCQRYPWCISRHWYIPKIPAVGVCSNMKTYKWGQDSRCSSLCNNQSGGRGLKNPENGPLFFQFSIIQAKQWPNRSLLRHFCSEALQ